jgi:hypothetical protein
LASSRLVAGSPRLHSCVFLDIPEICSIIHLPAAQPYPVRRPRNHSL